MSEDKHKHVVTTVTIEKGLLELAKKHGINISMVLEVALVKILKKYYGINYELKEMKRIKQFLKKQKHADLRDYYKAI